MEISMMLPYFAQVHNMHILFQSTFNLSHSLGLCYAGLLSFIFHYILLSPPFPHISLFHFFMFSLLSSSHFVCLLSSSQTPSLLRKIIKIYRRASQAVSKQKNYFRNSSKCSEFDQKQGSYLSTVHRCNDWQLLPSSDCQ